MVNCRLEISDFSVKADWQQLNLQSRISYLQFLLMPHKKSITLRCPICKKAVKAGNVEFPFCSPRCRTIDLGKWARGDYVISSPVKDTDEAEGGEREG